MPVICIGPVCIPIWHVWLLLLFVWKPIYRWIQACFGREKTFEDEVDPSAAELIQGEVREIIDEAGWALACEDASEGSIPMIVDFSATWCKPCKQIAPFYKELSGRYKGVFCKVDVENVPALNDMAGVKALPTFQVWGGDEPRCVGEVVGANKRELEALIAKHSNLKKSIEK